MKYINIILIILIMNIGSFSQYRDLRPKDKGYAPSDVFQKVAVVLDRAQSVHTINQLGQTVTNMGQFYAFSGTLPAGRWPIGSNHDQIYKMNFYVGVPYNVVASRASKSKEWDPMFGFHNRDTGKVAISTNKNSWPKDQTGKPFWPVRTYDNKDSIVSQEDTYGVYNDETNMRVNQKLRIKVQQTSYAWSTSKDEDYIFFKFEIINDTTVAKDSVYMALYCDFDAGGISSDYEDDKWGLDMSKNFFYIYDADGISKDWTDGKPFYLGVAFLETPKKNGNMLGITDWHYSSDSNSPWGDVLPEDTILYQWMSSDIGLKNNTKWPNLFHGNNLKIDDVSLINPKGERLDCIAASGPYSMAPKEKLTFIVVMLAGKDSAHIYKNLERATQIYNNGFQLIPPPKPELKASAFEGKVTLSWSNKQEFTYTDPKTGSTLVSEYRIYKTIDPDRKNWGNPVAIIKVDTTLKIVKEDAYQWVDSTNIKNNFYYSYSVTSFDVDGLESGRAFLPSNKTSMENTVEVRPVTKPKTDLDNVKVVPNPYVISATWERKRLGDPQYGEPIRDISFINLPEQCTIKIFTIDGDLVRTIEHNNGTGTEFWDVRSDANQLIATGVYFYHIKSPVGEKVGKFAIIR